MQFYGKFVNMLIIFNAKGKFIPGIENDKNIEKGLQEFIRVIIMDNFLKKYPCISVTRLKLDETL